MNRQILLKGMPIELFEAFDEATEGLLRDYFYTAMAGHEPFSVVDVATARQAKANLARAVAAARRRADAADVRLYLSAGEAAAFGLLQAVLEHTNRLARDGELLALPVLPEIAQLRNWFCSEILAQAEGAQPTSRERAATPLEEPGLPPATWPDMDTLAPGESWIVGDDGNRIIGASPAALRLLGWQHLVGERISAIIPTRHRDQHIAAFTRGVVTDDYRYLDQPLALTALRHDGSEIAITLTLSAHVGVDGRRVFLANLVAGA
jgi:PAS domain-containing protein